MSYHHTKPVPLTVLARIPVEIFSRIFAIGAEDSSIAVPCAVSRVCKRWREVVLNTPEAWSYIRVNRPTPHDGINYWLTRSGMYPLNIRISAYAGLPATTPEAFEALIAPLLPHVSRWRDFQCYCYNPEFLFEPLRRIRPDAARLVSIEIVPHFLHRTFAQNSGTQIFSRPPPSLRTLQLTRVSLSDAFYFVSPVLQTLDISVPVRERIDPPVQLTVHILRGCASRLTTLSLSTIEHNLELSRAKAPIYISLPSLRYLSLCQILGVDILIGCLAFPALQTLKIERCHSDLSAVFDHLVKTKSCQGIQHLVMVKMGLVKEDKLIKWLYSLPLLKSLDLKFTPVTVALADALSQMELDDVPALCPALTDLEFDRQDHLPAESLIPLARARHAVGRRFKSLLVRNVPTPAHLETLRKYIDKVN